MATGVPMHSSIRVCCVCSRQTRRRGGRWEPRPFLPGEPILVSITPLLYHKARGRPAQVLNSRCVRICEDCLVKVATSPAPLRGDAGKFWRALIGSFSGGYETLKHSEGRKVPSRTPALPANSLPLSTNGSLFGHHEVLSGEHEKEG
jgi:hypothetical protein